MRKPEGPAAANSCNAGAAAAKLRKGLWSPEEDERLFAQITYHGVSTWSSVAQLAGKAKAINSFRSLILSNLIWC